MSRLVDPSTIEAKVGAARHDTLHIARAVSEEELVYILHSRQCVDAYPDLRVCPFSLALDKGISLITWGPHLDKPMVITTDAFTGLLAPIKEAEAEK